MGGKRSECENLPIARAFGDFEKLQISVFNCRRIEVLIMKTSN